MNHSRLIAAVHGLIGLYDLGRLSAAAVIAGVVVSVVTFLDWLQVRPRGPLNRA